MPQRRRKGGIEKMSIIIMESPYNGGKTTVCHLSGKVLKVSCLEGCYEGGKECEFYLPRYPFCKRADEFIAEYEKEQ